MLKKGAKTLKKKKTMIITIKLLKNIKKDYEMGEEKVHALKGNRFKV